MAAEKEVEEVDKIAVGPSEALVNVNKVGGQSVVVRNVVEGEVVEGNEVPMHLLLTTMIATSVNGAIAHITMLRDREVDSNLIINSNNINSIMKNSSIMCSASRQISLPTWQDYKSMINPQRITIFPALLNSKEDGVNFPKEVDHCNTPISLNLRQPLVENVSLLLNGIPDPLMPRRNTCNTDEEEEVVVVVLEVEQVDDNSGIIRSSNNINHLTSHNFLGARVPKGWLSIGKTESFTLSP